jgi:hypothetical protein
MVAGQVEFSEDVTVAVGTTAACSQELAAVGMTAHTSITLTMISSQGMTDFAYTVILRVAILITVCKGMESWLQYIRTPPLEYYVTIAARSRNPGIAASIQIPTYLAKIRPPEPVPHIVVRVVAIGAGHSKIIAAAILVGMHLCLFCGTSSRSVTGKTKHLYHRVIA